MEDLKVKKSSEESDVGEGDDISSSPLSSLSIYTPMGSSKIPISSSPKTSNSRKRRAPSLAAAGGKRRLSLISKAKDISFYVTTKKKGKGMDHLETPNLSYPGPSFIQRTRKAQQKSTNPIWSQSSMSTPRGRVWSFPKAETTPKSFIGKKRRRRAEIGDELEYVWTEVELLEEEKKNLKIANEKLHKELEQLREELKVKRSAPEGSDSGASTKEGDEVLRKISSIESTLADVLKKGKDEEDTLKEENRLLKEETMILKEKMDDLEKKSELHTQQIQELTEPSTRQNQGSGVNEHATEGTRQRAVAAHRKADAAQRTADAAHRKADAAQRTADAAQQTANEGLQQGLQNRNTVLEAQAQAKDVQNYAIGLGGRVDTLEDSCEVNDGRVSQLEDDLHPNNTAASTPLNQGFQPNELSSSEDE